MRIGPLGRPIVGALAALVVCAAGCAGPRATPIVEPAAALACRSLIDGSGRDVGPTIAWRSPDDARSRRALTATCHTVGPGVYGAPTQADGPATGTLAVVSWNMHVGGGDLAALVAALRSGQLTDGVPVGNFVLLLQEVFRGGPAVPRALAPGVRVPDRIEARTPRGERHDVVAAANALGLGVFYLPSMRNGAETGPRSEDRGSAILSTEPLSALTALELPYIRQRRVALSASVTGTTANGQPWQLRVVSAHLDASTGPKYFWLFSSAERERQARWLADALGEAGTVATIVGADLNTWAGGRREPAYIVLRRAFPQPAAPTRATYLAGLTLDYLFFRLPAAWQGTAQTAGDRFGSDHRPVIGWIRFATGRPSQPSVIIGD